MKNFIYALILILVISLVGCGSGNKPPDKPPVKYPVTKKVDHADDYHGTKVKDPYRWLEDMKSPETAKWVQAQKKVTDDYLAAIPFRSGLEARFKELWNYERYTIPRKNGDFYVFTKNDGLQEQSVYYIQKGLDGKPEVLLDPNTMSKDGSVSLTGVFLSNDQKYVGYGISRGGSDWREFFVMELESRKKLDDHIKWGKFTRLAWYKDGFFYSRYDAPKAGEKLKAKVMNHKIFYHKIGTPQEQDQLVYQDPTNPKLGFNGTVTDDEKYLIITGWLGASDYNLLYYKNLETDSKISLITGNLRGHFDFVGEHNGRFFLLTDYKAPNYKLISVDPQNPKEENWEMVLPESKHLLRNVSLVAGKLIATYRKDAFTFVTVFDPEGKKLHDVVLPGIGTAYGFFGKKEEKEVFYVYTSMDTPAAIYRYNIAENKSTLYWKPKIKFDPDMFETKQVFFESKDKTRIPMFLVHKKGLKLDGTNPTLISGYGGFNAAVSPVFRTTIIPLIESGGVFVNVCLRGGGEYGENWHKAGKLDKKQNVFDDCIAAAEFLIREKYTSPERLALLGASNGGLLVGAVINQRPELFKVAIPAVGVMDMLRFHKFTIGWAWVGEYGSSENPDHFKFLYAYSPLHNIKAGLKYPAVLVTTADHDDRVFPAHSFKYISELQDKYKGPNPVLIRIETKVGHGAGTSTSKTIKLQTDIYSFLFYNMNIEYKSKKD